MLKRILIAGETEKHSLEMSYYKAFLDAGYEVRLFDTKKAVQKYARGGKLGYKVHLFFPVDAWLRKANKEFTELVKSFEPAVLIAFTGAEILPGSFAYIKSILPVRVIWYWADPLPNLSRYIHQSLALTDLVASYSRSSLNVFKAMGATATCWLPFAADIVEHFEKAVSRNDYNYDVSFIGSWRPEREEMLQEIYENFPDLKYKVSGPYWNRCQFKPLRKIAATKPIYGKSFSAIVQKTRLNLNVIDRSNYPSVNMRFFEIMAAGGLELCSGGPEMEDVFIDKEHILYFKSKQELIEKINFALQNKEAIEKVKIAGQDLLIKKHLYSHRVQLLETFFPPEAIVGLD